MASRTPARRGHKHELSDLLATGVTDGYVLTADGNGGAAFEAAAGGSSSFELKYKASDELRYNETDPTDDADLVDFALDADSLYYFEAYLPNLSQSTNRDFRVQLSFSNEPQSTFLAMTKQRTSIYDVQGTGILHTTTGTGPYILGPLYSNTLSNNRQRSNIYGHFKTNASTGGTVDFQWNCRVPTASAAFGTTLYAGAWMKVTKLG